jgi:HEAT repeat protein
MMKEGINCIKVLSELDWWDREKKISNLINQPIDTYVQFLEDALRNHDDANIRNTSMEIYKALGTRAFASLFKLIKDEDPEVRLFTVNILGEIRDSSAQPPLLELIKDPDEMVRTATAETLGKTGDARAVSALRTALDDEPWVAMAAIQAIGEIGGNEALSILYECLEREDLTDFTITSIEKSGNRDSIEKLATFISKTEHVFHRELALDAIIKIAERERVRLRPENLREIMPLLLETMDSQDTDMKKSAFIALCWSEDINGLPYFLSAIDDDELQEYAIDGLLSLGRRAAPAVVEALKETDGDNRSILAKVLVMLGENRALMQFNKDENPDVRTEVALALGSVYSASSVRALLNMLSDPFDEVRFAARTSLGKMKEQKASK